MDWKAKFAKPEIEYWPEVRWWLAEGFHTDQTLKKDISLIHDSGFGAVEFLAMDEPSADSELYGWGSEEWVHDSHIVMQESTDKGMGVSMTSGTNWSNANLITITPDDKAASKELDFTSEVLSAGSARNGPLKQCCITQENVFVQEIVAVLAMKRQKEDDGKTYLDKNSSIILTDRVVDLTLEWTAPKDGDYELFVFWLHGTGQTASPSVSVSYTINYIDRYGVETFIDYWSREVITEEMKECTKSNNRAQMYMDSLELCTFGSGGQFWGYFFLEEFQHRRGYDLTTYLPFILKESGMFLVDYIYHYTCDDKIFLEKLHNDLYQTMTDLYMDNMLKPMQEWLHSIGMTLRAEISYGLPFEISQPGKYVDGIETESLEFCSQIESYRNLAGPAHLYRRLYSSETGATQLNYMMGLDFYTQIIYTQFASGVTKTVLHGYSSIAGSDNSTYWPGHEGMWPIFSERFGVRQPAFQHYNDWTGMLARYQMILRQGKPRMDLGILRLDYNFNNMISFNRDNSEREFYESGGMRANEGLYWKDMRLQNSGYTYDYFAPQILEETHLCYDEGTLDPDGPGYQALILYQEGFPLSTASKLLKWAKAGLPILFVNGVDETIRPLGIHRTHAKAACRTISLDNKDEELATVIAEIKALPNVKEVNDQNHTLEALQELGVYPRAAFTEENKCILTNLREDGAYRYLFVYNYMYSLKKNVPITIAIEGIGKPYRIDCWTGTVKEISCYEHKEKCTLISLLLKPGQAALIALDMSAPEETDKTSKANEFLPDPIPLERWNLEVEDWNEGKKVTITENRGLGIVTNEVYYETTKERIHVGETTLKSWKDIKPVGPELSGVGYYTTTVTLPETWTNVYRTILEMESTCGNSAAVYINGKKADPVDFNLLGIDITDLLIAGNNTICIEVSSTLNNRLLARGYYAKSGKTSFVQDYGLLGEVKLVPYPGYLQQ